MIKGGIELGKVFNTHKDKTREGQEGLCMAHVHDIIKRTMEGRSGNLQKRMESCKGVTGHNFINHTF